jgi:polyferredoxin
VLHDRNPLYVTLSSGDIRNGYKIKILNKTHDEKHYALMLDGLQDFTMEFQGAGNPDKGDLVVAPDSVGQFRLFISAPKPDIAQKDILFTIKDLDSEQTSQAESSFISSGAR